MHIYTFAEKEAEVVCDDHKIAKSKYLSNIENEAEFLINFLFNSILFVGVTCIVRKLLWGGGGRTAFTSL